ncbi:DUF2442 domain-containing protein [Echinicola vietnamensis]|uniref:DUF2442 domain-containing protein n=1 Tax=Echinicola vietnamensis (strain DSM 17526 / LMG 23754 / KMM 6221) TaxID=926556 RepID=L0FX00_ECHVK|nr:DUF2442 domain-containing protein [Echinicola vietnamensis]AGA77543.1 Protein of unknown function (DUF2442) [Echinicola vietnamensis DSM 17526]
MKVREEFVAYRTTLIGIEAAEYIGQFRIRVLFKDKTEKTVDFRPFLRQSTHPEIQKYLDEVHFRNFKVKDDNLQWGDYEMIFPISELYKGKISF